MKEESKKKNTCELLSERKEGFPLLFESGNTGDGQKASAVVSIGGFDLGAQVYVRHEVFVPESDDLGGRETTQKGVLAEHEGS